LDFIFGGEFVVTYGLADCGQNFLLGGNLVEVADLDFGCVSELGNDGFRYRIGQFVTDDRGGYDGFGTFCQLNEEITFERFPHGRYVGPHCLEIYDHFPDSAQGVSVCPAITDHYEDSCCR